MRGVFRFLAPRLLRALIAVWLVSTVVFVVMRLSGDPVPLLLPPDAPRSEIFRVRRELGLDQPLPDRKSTRLNSSHGYISYAVFCLKKKKKTAVIAALTCGR